MVFGYARVSTDEQNLDLQLDALQGAGCDRIYKDKVSGIKAERPELGKLLDQIREGDTVVIWKLDRLGRSLSHLIATVSEFEKKGVGFKSLQDNFDTTTPTGKLTFHMVGAFAEFERDLGRSRTMAGLASARARGRTGGRPKGLSPEQNRRADIVVRLYQAGDSISSIQKDMKISSQTVYRWLRIKGAYPPNATASAVRPESEVPPIRDRPASPKISSKK